MQTVYQGANGHLENGVIAEFESKIDTTRRPQPAEFRAARDGYVSLQRALKEFDAAIEALQAADAKCEKIAAYEKALTKVLAEGPPLVRLGRAGVRYADAGGVPADRPKPIEGTSGILAAWRADLQVLSNVGFQHHGTPAVQKHSPPGSRSRDALRV